MKPKVSIIVVNFNGEKWLSNFVASLKKQTYKDFEFIFVDNNSSDNSVKFIKDNYPGANIVELEENLGFAGGNNKGFEIAKGELILFLNNDTYFNKNFLKNFVEVFDNEISIAQSKIVLTDEKTIDSCGSFWTNTTFMYYYGNGKEESLEKYNKPFKVFSIKGASFMVRRKVIEKIGLFDEDFWNYYEETDFCHRAGLAGYVSWYTPKPVCYHVQGGTSLTFDNDYIQFHNFKNKLSSFIKNFELLNLLWVVPVFVLLNIILSIYWLIIGKWKHMIALYKAIWWNLRNVRMLINKRKVVQNNRKLTDKSYFNKITINPSLGYYYVLLTNNFSNYEDKEI